ncbi:MAG: hypothetical protein C4313_09690 [Thermoflexus sp.]|uniref:hypothetical protein n=1 Tax=Thermoflexus sp. TaxID=1969742 RepID=UPI0033304E0A
MGRRKGVLWILMGIAVALAFVLSPSLQRVAHAVLQGFRFRRVLVVPYTFAMPQASLENLRRILGGDLAVEGADPRLVQTPEEAETLLGFRIRRLPGVEAFATLQVIPVTTVRWTVRLDHLREALHAVGADDVALPETLDGTAMTLTGGPVLLATLEHQGTPLGFLQAPLPALTMSPEGDVRPLAEATLRLMGMPAAEARRLANTVDWQTTLLLPVPLAAGMAVEVQPASLGGGREGTLFTFPTAATPSGELVAVRFLLWHDAEFLYGLGGPEVDPDRLLAWARSLR